MNGNRALLWSSLLAAGVALLALSGCKRDGAKALPVKKTHVQQEVEVVPGKWITVERDDEEVQVDVGKHVSLNIPLPGDTDVTRLRIPWQDQTVVWEGTPVPFCLREWEEKLFVIGLDRSDMKKCRFRYYRQDGDHFSDIQPGDFPKRIATQNMWFRDVDYYTIGAGGERIYDLQLARQLDPENVYFGNRLTAQVWQHLTDGKDYHQTKGGCDRDTLRAFKKAHAPIALPTIVRTPDGWPGIPATTTSSGPSSQPS